MAVKWLILVIFLLGICILGSIIVYYIVAHRRQRRIDITPNISKGDILCEVPIREMQADFGANIQVNIKQKNIKLSIPQGSIEGDLLRLKWHGKYPCRHAYFLIHVIDPSVSLDSVFFRAPKVRDIILSSDTSGARVSLPTPDPSTLKKSSRSLASQLDTLHTPSVVNELPIPSELNALKNRLLQLLYGNKDTYERLIEFEHKQNPDKSEIEVYQDAIDRLQRDRGYW
jgi:hypothetical protein